MAELADAHGSGPCDSNIMRVQVPFSALDFRNRICFLNKYQSKTLKRKVVCEEDTEKDTVLEVSGIETYEDRLRVALIKPVDHVTIT